MIVGWRDRVSLTPEIVASICSRSTVKGLSPYDREAFAAELGLETEPPQSYSVDAFYNLLTYCGPLWVSKIMGGGAGASGHAVVDRHTARVTTITSDRRSWIVSSARRTPALCQHAAAPAAAIMRQEDFQNEYELRSSEIRRPARSSMRAERAPFPNTATGAALVGYAMAAPSRSRAKVCGTVSRAGKMPGR
jgi:hypothetical protein